LYFNRLFVNTYVSCIVIFADIVTEVISTALVKERSCMSPAADDLLVSAKRRRDALPPPSSAVVTAGSGSLKG